MQTKVGLGQVKMRMELGKRKFTRVERVRNELKPVLIRKEDLYWLGSLFAGIPSEIGVSQLNQLYKLASECWIDFVKDLEPPGLLLLRWRLVKSGI